MLLATDIKNKSVRLVAFENVQHFAFENPNVNCEYNKASYFNASGDGQWELDLFLPPDAFRISYNKVLGHKYLDVSAPIREAATLIWSLNLFFYPKSKNVFNTLSVNPKNGQTNSNKSSGNF